MRDSLEAALKVKPAVVIHTQLVWDTIRIRDTVTVTVDATDTRRASLDRTGPGWSASAQVALPPPPAPGLMELSVRLSDVVLGVRLGCGAPVGGVRPATARVDAPAWVRVQLDQVLAEPGVCNPPSLMTPTGGAPWWTLPAVGFIGLVAGLLR